MLLIIEILMLISGIWAIATGKIPSLLFGGGQYTAEGLKVRLLGVLLVLPIPIALVGGVLLTLLFGEVGTDYARTLEIVTVIGVAIVALVVFRFIRQPVVITDSSGKVIEDASRIEATIAKKAQGALMYAIFGGLGIPAIVVCPLAVIYATQALRLIDKHKVGEQHRSKANLARIIAVVAFLFYAGIACLVLLVAVGNR